MRTFAFFNTKWDKRYIFCAILTLIVGIICGIVLNKSIVHNINFKKYATEYIYNVFNFKNSNLIFSYFFSELLFCFLFLGLIYFLKLKYLTLFFIYIKGLFLSIYIISLYSVNAFTGMVVILFIYLPTSLISIFANILCAEICKSLDLIKALIFPFILCLASVIIYFVLINVIFRFIVIIA